MLTRRALLQAGGGIAGLALLAQPLRTRAESVIEIAMRGNSDGSKVWFDPIGLLVEPGQTLRWVNRDPGNAHTSTAFHPANGGHPLRIPTGAAPWNSDYLLPEQTFDLRLTASGVYDYFCIPHEEAGMVGRIVVGQLDRGPLNGNWPETARGQLPTPEEIVRRKVIRRSP